MLTRAVLLSALALADVSTAVAERKCTPSYSHVLIVDQSAKLNAATTADGCRAACISDSKCAAYSFLANLSCLTMTAVASETYDPVATAVSARCMDASALRLLLLDKENADYAGLDLGNAPAANPTECGYKCQDTPGCNAYSWTNYNGGSCWMKSGKPDVITGPYDGSVVSGEVYTCQRPQFDSDIIGEDLSNVQRPKWTDCCGVCRRTSGCVAFSWSVYYDVGTCWLKKKATGFSHTNGGVVAAILQ